MIGRRSLVWCDPLLNTGGALPQLDAGLHHFMVCVYKDGDEIDEITSMVFDDLPRELGLANLIPHKFMVDAEGAIIKTIGDELTQTERADYRRLMSMMQFTPSDTIRLKELRAKMSALLLPPSASIAALRRALSAPLIAGSGADQFFIDATIH